MRLILMRHAKSSWSTAALADHDRPLNGRGRRSATALGSWLRAWGYVPDQVLCSTATRTRETLAGLAIKADVQFDPALYLADPATMLAAVRAATGKVVLMIGHNPGIAELAAELVAKAPAHDRFMDYPTGATLVVDFAAGWPDIMPGTGQVVDFVVPRELTD